MFDLKAADVYFSDKCNLSCDYCYVLKPLDNYPDVSEYIKTGKWIVELQNKFPNLEYLGFWGKEPTLNLKLLEKDIHNLPKSFPNLKSIAFSTNFVDIENLKWFVNNLPNSIDFNFQISLDGNEELSSLSRGQTFHNKIIKNILDFASFSKDRNIKVFSRATWNKKILKFLSDKNKMVENIEFFSDLNKKIRDLGNNNMLFATDGCALAKPLNMYDQKDGINFSKLAQNIIELEDENMKIPYFEEIFSLVKHNKETWIDMSSCMCSAGKTSFGFFSNEIYPCHSQFNRDDKILLFKDKEELQKIIQIISSYQALTLAHSKEIIKNLLKIGLIKESSTKEEYVNLVIGLLKIACFQQPYETKKSFYVNSIGSFQLFLNGAIEKLCKLYELRRIANAKWYGGKVK